MAERLIRRLGLAWLAATCLLAIPGAAPAQACDSINQHDFGVSPGCSDIRVIGTPTGGNVAPDYFQAGGDPYEVATALRLNAPAEADPIGGPYFPPEALRDASLSLPAGLIANPAAVPPCSMQQLVGVEGFPTCLPDSQVGLLTISVYLFGTLEQAEAPLFRMAAPAGVPARFGFNPIGVPIVLDARVSDGGSSLSIDISKLSEAMPVIGLDVNLWGIPSDPSHTPKRACPGKPPTKRFSFITPAGPSCPASQSPRSFLRLPTSCNGPAKTSSRLDSWARPGVYDYSSAYTHLAPGLIGDPTAGLGYPAAFPGLPVEQWGAPQGFEGCDRLAFEPSFEIEPSSHVAGGPTGLDVEVKLPQAGLEDPSELAESDLENVVAKLPVGMSLNPAVANGLSACTAAEVDLDSSDEPACPDSSKLGSVEMTSPLLAGVLSGSIYNAEQGAAAGTAALPAYVVAGSGAAAVKLRASLDIDRETGQVSAVLNGLPQIPIGSFRMHFFGGDRAPLVNPLTCGTHVSEGRLTPWSGTAPVARTDSFQISSGPHGGACVAPHERPFKPGFLAGVTSPVAGAPSALTVKLSRDDGEQEPSSLKLSLPPGLAASLRDVPTCSDAALEAAAGRGGIAEVTSPSCPAASRIGSVAAVVGAGGEPFHLKTGRIYLAGPYKGAAFSFAAVLPVVAGPIDLSTLAIRLPIKVDPGDGHLIVATDFPTAQNGVPLNLRQITLDIDRPGFISNPTSCRPALLGGLIGGSGGASATVSSPFQITGCTGLGFGPRLKMTVLGGVKATRHKAHPAIRSVLTARPGDANIAGATIVFPGSEQLDPSHIKGICTRVQFAAASCPRDSVYGYAKVLTPSLSRPLRGFIYMRSSSHKLPDLVAALHGQLDLNLTGQVDFSKGRMRVAMGSLPDVPLTKLVLTTRGGRRGLFVNNRDLCVAPSAVDAELSGHNGKRSLRQAELRVSCSS